MPHKFSLWTFKVFIAAASLTVAVVPYLQAGYRCHCEPSIAVYQSPFFGYYRTCWRPWPGGQPLCPRYAVAEAEGPRAAERTIEQLPPPRPEEPEIK
jgi:hypothetical protein